MTVDFFHRIFLIIWKEIEIGSLSFCWTSWFYIFSFCICHCFLHSILCRMST